MKDSSHLHCDPYQRVSRTMHKYIKRLWPSYFKYRNFMDISLAESYTSDRSPILHNDSGTNERNPLHGSSLIAEMGSSFFRIHLWSRIQKHSGSWKCRCPIIAEVHLKQIHSLSVTSHNIWWCIQQDYVLSKVLNYTLNGGPSQVPKQYSHITPNYLNCQCEMVVCYGEDG